MTDPGLPTIPPPPTRLQRCRLWVRRHPWRTAALVLLVGFVALNVVAYRHARAMLTFAERGVRPPSLHDMTLAQKLGVIVGGVTLPRPENGKTPADAGLAFRTHVIAGDGVQLEAWEIVHPQPRGTVLLFHGYAGAKASLLREAAAFHELGYTAILVDFRGSGGSSERSTTIGYTEADDVAAVVRWANGRGPLVLFGQSMGAAAVLRAIAVHDLNPDALILESVFDRLLSTVRNRFELFGLPAWPVAELMVFWGGVQCGFSGFAHNPVEYARHSACPALVLHGTDDRHTKLAEGEAVFAALAGRKALSKFAGVRHTSLFGAAPEVWRAAVREFLP